MSARRTHRLAGLRSSIGVLARPPYRWLPTRHHCADSEYSQPPAPGSAPEERATDSVCSTTSALLNASPTDDIRGYVDERGVRHPLV